MSFSTIIRLAIATAVGGMALYGAERIDKPGHFDALTEPPCSYCSTQHRKGFTGTDERVIAWIRAAHNGGAIPIKPFLSKTRIINDTYGLFFHDTDGGYVTAFEKDYGYTFQGWRRGVMLVRGPDGTIWSALSGRGIEGPQTGKRLNRVPNFMTTWGHWLMLHPESTAYDLFDGQRYESAEWSTGIGPEARNTMGEVDPRLPATASVIGVEGKKSSKAYPLEVSEERACIMDELDGERYAVFWYAPTKSAVVFNARLGDRELNFYADGISPDTAPFKDRETGTRWTLAGRGVDGPLRGKELDWMPSVQCRWYAWAAEYPDTLVHPTGTP